MVIYEITAEVDAALIENYEKYMRERHIHDLLATGFFAGAKLARAGDNRFRIQYFAIDRQALDEYLQEEAVRLRADFTAHFPEGVELKREIWDVVEIWEAQNKSAAGSELAV